VSRLNVAISRARCLAVLVASPGLLDLAAKSVDEMKLANVFCWAAEFAGAPGQPRSLPSGPPASARKAAVS
jgi:hypothetical protein